MIKKRKQKKQKVLVKNILLDLLSCSMKKIVIISIPMVLLICGFSIKSMLPKKDTVLNHIALHVSDLQKSSLFYEKIVQLDSVAEPFHDGNHTWLNIGDNARLHLIGRAVKDSVHDKNSHLCFSVVSIDEFIARLNTAQIPFENWVGVKNTFTKRVDGIKQIYFQDPDGYWVEINDDHR